MSSVSRDRLIGVAAAERALYLPLTASLVIKRAVLGLVQPAPVQLAAAIEATGPRSPAEPG